MQRVIGWTGCLGLIVGIAIVVSPSRSGDEIKIGKTNVPVEIGKEFARPLGSEIRDLAFKDVDGKEYYLHDLTKKGPVALVFLSTICPEANRYPGRLQRLQDEFGQKNVTFLAVYPNEEETLAGIKSHAKERALSYVIVRDMHGYLADGVGATMTPQALVIDRQNRLRYRGAIDDNRIESRVRQSYLQDALLAVVAGKEVAVPVTETRGCTIHLTSAKDTGKVTYSKHIARIIHDNCTICHRPGQVGPFSLTKYAHAKAFAKEIKAHTQARIMPPWKAEDGFGTFKNNRRLTDEEIALISRWVADGMPKGDDSELPPAPRFNDEWILGEPDLVVEMPEEYTLGAEGEDDYRHFIIPTNLGEDKYVTAIDVRPGNRKIVHHVIAYVDVTGKARELDAKDPGPGYTSFGSPGFKVTSMLGGWAPGTMPEQSPKGTGFLLPNKGDVVLQVHYYRSGTVEKDRTKVGLYFSKTPKTVRIHTGLAINNRFKIPAGADNYKVVANWTVKTPLYAFSVYPHMHLLGKEMKVTAILPNGEEKKVIWIKNWDFNWQTSYVFREPMHLPAGTVVRAVAYYDNSKGNPNNPNNPPQVVGWGERTSDEMCIAFMDVVSAHQYQPKQAR